MNTVVYWATRGRQSYLRLLQNLLPGGGDEKEGRKGGRDALMILHPSFPPSPSRCKKGPETLPFPSFGGYLAIAPALPRYLNTRQAGGPGLGSLIGKNPMPGWGVMVEENMTGTPGIMLTPPAFSLSLVAALQPLKGSLHPGDLKGAKVLVRSSSLPLVVFEVLLGATGGILKCPPLGSEPAMQCESSSRKLGSVDSAPACLSHMSILLNA